eukprot:TRINITY_DN27159_c0_g1_i1.p1 TRINITY_DN27159_c0_g1~~TRINITY_DN27159_c0_g1_i1.p1  ORF type:complete len:842 (-),score=113.48 TRINITY_DN27159_c0_g1_i1:148-2673(-)
MAVDAGVLGVRCCFGGSPPWTNLAILTVSFAHAVSGATFDFTAGNSDLWNPRDFDKVCPVAMSVDVEEYTGVGGGLLFTPQSHDFDLDVFTVAQREIPQGSFLLDGGTVASGGLLLTISGLGDMSNENVSDVIAHGNATDASPWRIQLRYADNQNVSFLTAFEVRPGGPRTAYLPWSSFSARVTSDTGIQLFKEQLKPSVVTVVAVSEPQHKSTPTGGEVSRLVLHKAEISTPIDGVKVPVELDSSGNVVVEKECLCNASCARFRLEFVATRSAGYCHFGATGGRGQRAFKDGTFLDACLAVLRGPATRLASGLSMASCPTWTDSSPGAIAGKWLDAAVKAEAFLRVCKGPAVSSRVISDMVYSVLISGGLPEGFTPVQNETMTNGFFGPFAGKAITYRNNLPMWVGDSRDDCLKRCEEDVRCRSVDYGARGPARTTCLLSTADRESAWGLFDTTPAFDYYEKPLPTASLGFHGPWIGMGISGRNDLDKFVDLDVDACLGKCKSEPRCRSVDFGARGEATGECWLSTGDRKSDANRFTRWTLYDYYELPAASAFLTSLEMATARPDDEKEALKARVPLVFDSKACCTEPASCVKAAISVGAKMFNTGEKLGCYWIYHNAASHLKDCPSLNDFGASWLGSVFSASIAGASATTSAPESAWIIRGAFDTLLALEQCDPTVAEDLSVEDPLPYLLEDDDELDEDVEEEDDENEEGEDVEETEEDEERPFRKFSNNRSQYKSPARQVVIKYVVKEKDVTEEKLFPVLIVVILVAVVLIIALAISGYLLFRLKRQKSAANVGASNLSNPNVVVGHPVEEMDDAQVVEGTNLSVPAGEDGKATAKEP